MMRVRADIAVILCAASTGAAAQIAPDGWPARPWDGEPAFLRILVYQDDPYPDYALTWHTAPGRPPASREESLARPVTVVRSSTGGPTLMARSSDCPGIRDAMSNLYAIAPIPMTPSVLQPFSGEVIPITPTVKDGATYYVSLSAPAANGNAVEVTIKDYDGDYAMWANRAERALSDCWGPLR